MAKTELHARQKVRLIHEIKPDKNTQLLLLQTNEKLSALFHKVHNLQVEVADLTKTIKTANLLWVKVLESSTSRDDAAAAVAVERAERIQKYSK